MWRFAGLDPTLKWLGKKDATKLVGEHVKPGKKVSEAIFALICGETRRNLVLARNAMGVGVSDSIPRAAFIKYLAKRPHNAALKTLAWKIGESFVLVSGNENAFYGQAYAYRKALETKRNEAGEFKAQAVAGAERVRSTTEAFKHYSKGVLPPGHIHARAKRWAVKLFLAHYHEIGHELATGNTPPAPYPIRNIPGHSFKIPPGGSPEALAHLKDMAA